MVRVFITDLTNIQWRLAHIPFSNAITIVFRTFDKLASFGYNKAEGGELDMRREKRYIYMDSAEHRLAIVWMNHFRNKLIQGGKPTEDVDALLLKLWKAKAKRRNLICAPSRCTVK